MFANILKIDNINHSYVNQNNYLIGLIFKNNAKYNYYYSKILLVKRILKKLSNVKITFSHKKKFY